MSRRPFRRWRMCVALVGTMLLAACAVDPHVTTGSARAAETVPTDPTVFQPDDTVVDVGTSDTLPAPTEAPLEPPSTDPLPSPTSPTDATPDTSPPDLGDPTGNIIDFGDDKRSRDYDRYLELVIEDLRTWWGEEFPSAFAGDYEPLKGGVFAGYPGRTDIPGCGEGSSTPYDVVQGNAFYCPFGDFIAYDDAQLFPTLERQLGRTALGIVLAHEWGHSIQPRASVPETTPTIIVEQQADCYAGAWAAHLARGENDNLPFGDEDLKIAMVGLIAVKDPVGLVDPNQQGAHGTAFDRVGAFQDGFTNGVTQCATYIDTPPKVLQFTWLSRQDELSGGNAPLDDPDAPQAPDDDPNTNDPYGIYGLLLKDLNRFWKAQFAVQKRPFTPPRLAGYDAGDTPPCDGADGDSLRRAPGVYCAADNTIYFNRTLGTALYTVPEQGGEGFGDYAIGYLLSTLYADAVQQAIDSTLQGEKRVLLSDCLAGVYTRDTVPKAQPDPNAADGATISPGDLDEAVQTALSISDAGTDDNVIGSAFEKVAAFRKGVLGGFDSCK